MSCELFLPGGEQQALGDLALSFSKQRPDFKYHLKSGRSTQCCSTKIDSIVSNIAAYPQPKLAAIADAAWSS
jgi:hypothetical protein